MVNDFLMSINANLMKTERCHVMFAAAPLKAENELTTISSTHDNADQTQNAQCECSGFRNIDGHLIEIKLEILIDASECRGNRRTKLDAADVAKNAGIRATFKSKI